MACCSDLRPRTGTFHKQDFNLSHLWPEGFCHGHPCLSIHLSDCPSAYPTSMMLTLPSPQYLMQWFSSATLTGSATYLQTLLNMDGPQQFWRIQQNWSLVSYSDHGQVLNVINTIQHNISCVYFMLDNVIGHSLKLMPIDYNWAKIFLWSV